MNPNIQLSNEGYPGLYQAADVESIRSQKTYYQLLLLYLCLLILGSIIAVFSGTSKLYALVAACSFLTSLSLFILMVVRRYDHTWYSARAVAESVKTRAWRYMMRSKPYANLESESSPENAFLSDLQQILQHNREVTKELCHESATRDAVTRKMEQIRSLELQDRIAFYKSQRIENQRDWYGQKAITNKKLGRNWFICMVGLQALAIICVLLRIAYPEWKYLPTGVFAVAAVSVVSWIQAKRFTELLTSCSLAAYEIGIIYAQVDSISTEDQFSSFVNDTENAFSREHTQWVARRNSRPLIFEPNKHR